VLVNNFKRDALNVINILSISANDGKTFIGDKIHNIMKTKGFKTSILSYETDFLVGSKEYLLANDISDLYSNNDDVVIVEHSSITQHSASEGLLNSSTINLLVIDAGTKWGNSKQALVDSIVTKAGNTPVFIYLNKVKREVLNDFTGKIK